MRKKFRFFLLTNFVVSTYHINYNLSTEHIQICGLCMFGFNSIAADDKTEM